MNENYGKGNKAGVIGAAIVGGVFGFAGALLGGYINASAQGDATAAALIQFVLTKGEGADSITNSLTLYEKMGVIKLKVSGQELRKLIDDCIGKGKRVDCK